jgi:hypothetical protein
MPHLVKVMSLTVLSVVITISDEDRAAKQSEVNLLMDEVERAQTRLLTLEREKVHFPIPPVFLKGSNLSLIHPTINLVPLYFFIINFFGPKMRENGRFVVIPALQAWSLAGCATPWRKKNYLSANSFT